MLQKLNNDTSLYTLFSIVTYVAFYGFQLNPKRKNVFRVPSF